MSAPSDTLVVQRETYRRLVLRKRLILAGLMTLLLCSVLLDLALGPASYSLREVLGALFSPDDASAQVRVVMWDIRLPVALMAVAVGAALSLAGAQMQTILNNPLASPFTLGISAAASFGAAIGLGSLSRYEGLFISRLLPLFAALAFVANGLGWLSHRQWHRSLLGMIGPAIVFAATVWLLGNWWTANLLYLGLALMVGVSVWDFVSPAHRRCGPDSCELPAHRG